MDRIVNNIQLTCNLTCVLKTQRPYNSIIIFSKYVGILIFLVRVTVLSYN